jgi:hypothetical protein
MSGKVISMGKKPTREKLKKLNGFVELAGRPGRRFGSITRLYGAILRMNDGKLMYLVLRKREDVFRSGEFNVNSAEAKGVAYWAMDESTMLDIRAKKIDYLGVWEYESGDKYISTVAAWDKAKPMSLETRGRMSQVHLPFSEFLIVQGKTKF